MSDEKVTFSRRDCYFCDPYSFHYRYPYRTIMPACEAHMHRADVQVSFGLPNGTETSWKRGTWA